MLVTDTVGFVRKLPHELVEAFRSTLDLRAPGRPHRPRGRWHESNAEGQMAAVHEVLVEIGRPTCPSWWW